MKKPDGTYPTAAGLTVTVQVLDPVTNCVLREETHTGVPVTNGYLNLVLGSVTPLGGFNPTPALSMAEVMDNKTPRLHLTCVDATNTPTLTDATYTPSDTQARKLRIRTTIAGDPIVADFNLRAVAFAVNAENLEGKTASGFIQTTAATTQANIESIFTRYSILDAILGGTYAGNAATATALASTPGACPAGQYVSAMTAAGAITCGTPSGGAGSVTSVSSANSYLSIATGTSTPVLTVNVGTAANTVAAGNDARFTDSRAPNGTAGGDLSGTYPNPTVAKVSGKAVTLTSPAAGDLLTYDGTKFVNSPPATAVDATKLPLAGGTMTGAIDLASQNLTSSGFITMSANKSLHLSNNAADPTGLVSADKGKIWFDSTNAKVKYWDGSAAQTLGVSGSGLQTFNTQTGSTQTLAIGTSGTAPGWSSATNVHTLNLPMASGASVTAGLISKTDYDAFSAKLDSSSALAGDVTGTSSTTSVDKIKGKAVVPTTYAAGQTLRYDGTQWVNAVLGFSDLGSMPTTLAGYGITDAQSTTLANGKILVGNASNVATAVTMSGDATLSNAGALTLATVPVSKGGTGLTALTGDKLITTSGAGAVQTTSCGLNQVVSFTAGGAITCANVSALSGSFVNGGNAFAGTATLGTTDANKLSVITNNTARLTVLSDGKVGLGTATPTSLFHLLQADSTVAGPDVMNIQGGQVKTAAFPFTGVAGAITLKTGYGGTTGGAISIVSGNGGYDGGAIDIHSGDGGSVAGGAVNLQSGAGGTMTIQSGGGLNISSGTAADSGLAQNITVTMANGVGASSGGSFYLTAGNGSVIDRDGGSVMINPGAKGGIGSDGTIILANLQGNVAVGTNTATSKLTVAGTIETTTGGVKFPDGTVLTSAPGLKGKLVMDSTALCGWAISTTTWTTFNGENTSCLAPTVTGAASIPAEGKIPGIRFASLPAGDYEVIAAISELTGDGTNWCAFRLFDGTTGSGNVTVKPTSVENHVIGQFSYATAQTNLTFYLQAQSEVNTHTCTVDLSGAPNHLEIWVKRL